MDEEDKQLLRQAVELSKENNEILRKLNRARVWGIAWTITYWVIIIGISLGIFYYLKPYVDSLREGLSTAQNQAEGLSGAIKRFFEN